MNMLAYTFLEQGTFKLLEKERPVILDDRDVIVTSTSSMALYQEQCQVLRSAMRWWA